MDIGDHRVYNGQTSHVEGCGISPNGKLVATGSRDSTIRIVNIDTGALVYQIIDVVWSPSGGRLLASCEDGAILEVRRLDNNGTAWTHAVLYKHVAPVNGITISRESVIALACADNQIILLQGTAGAARVVQVIPTNLCQWRLAFSPDCTLLAARTGRNNLHIFRRSANGSYTAVFSGVHHQVNALVFSPDGLLLLAGGADEQATIWDMPPSEAAPWASSPRLVLPGHKRGVRAVEFFADGVHAFTGAQDGTICVWRILDGKLIKRLTATSEVTALSFHAKTCLLTAGVLCTGAELWRATPNDLRTRITELDGDLLIITGQIAALTALCSTFDDMARLQDDTSRPEGSLVLSSGVSSPPLSESTVRGSLTGLSNARSLLEGLRNSYETLKDTLHFQQFLHECGLPHLLCRGIDGLDGRQLADSCISDLMTYQGLSYVDACDLHLRGYLAYSRQTTNAPVGSMAAWGTAEVADFLRTQGTVYEQLISANWSGPAHCCLSPPRIQEQAAGHLTMQQCRSLHDAVRRQVREDSPNWLEDWCKGGRIRF